MSFTDTRPSPLERRSNVPSHWRVERVSNRAKIEIGWTPATADDSNFEGDNVWANISDLGPRYLRGTAKRVSNNAVNVAGAKQVEAGSLLFSFKLSVGTVSFAAVPMYTNEAIAAFSPRSELDMRFAYYSFPIFILRNARENIYGAPILNQRRLAQTKIAFPPIDEQRAIADYLDRETERIDAFIAKNEELIALLAERRAAAIELAVDPAEHSSDWRLCQVRRLGPKSESGVSVNGYTVPAVGDELGVLKTAAVSKGYFDPSENKRVVEEDAERVAAPVRARTLIVNRANTPELVGNSAYVSEARPQLFLSDKLWQLTFAFADPAFIHYWTQSNSYRSQLRALSVGTSSSMQNLSYSDFLSMMLVVPPLSEQKEIVERLTRVSTEANGSITIAQRGIELARERRAALISAAVTGKIDVATAAT